MTKILLTGINGQVGQELQQTLTPLGNIIGLNRQQLDLTKPEQIQEAIATIKPDIIVNAAAYTAVDKAETEVDLAMAVNATAPQVIAEAGAKYEAVMVQISTDYVFSGKNHIPYTESDGTNPLGVYGKSKLLGENAVRNASSHHLIVRTAWVYGSHGQGNFVKTMLRLGATKTELGIVTDQIGSPTWSYDLARAIAMMLSKLPCNIPWGTYHFTNSGVASWYDFAVAIFEEARKLNFPLKIERIVPITTADYPTLALRPAYSVLNKHKISQILGEHPPYWRKSLTAMLSQWYLLNN